MDGDVTFVEGVVLHINILPPRPHENLWLTYCSIPGFLEFFVRGSLRPVLPHGSYPSYSSHSPAENLPPRRPPDYKISLK